jgi:hypothetical protein
MHTNEYGIQGTGTAPGRHTLSVYFPGAVVERNVMGGLVNKCGAASLPAVLVG